jgi:hypothetical protein
LSDQIRNPQLFTVAENLTHDNTVLCHFHLIISPLHEKNIPLRAVSFTVQEQLIVFKGHIVFYDSGIWEVRMHSDEATIWETKNRVNVNGKRSLKRLRWRW